jgi:transcription factor E
MQINLLKKVAENVAGEQAVKIVDLLFEKKDVNEFLIAKKLGLTINQTRNLLYKLSHIGLISSIRKKDKRKGWYIYFWTFNVLNSLEVLDSTMTTEINQMEEEIEAKKQSRFYKCKLCGREANEESALITNFVCSECGEVYDIMDNGPLIAEVAKKVEKLKKERENIRNEIKLQEEIISSKLNRSIKREDKKKKEIRKKAFEERKRLKMKLLKVSKKKPSKNKGKKKR